MTALVVGVLRETAPGEKRVALDPDATVKLITAGRSVVIEAGAGLSAGFSDVEYTGAGASVVTREAVLEQSDVIAAIRLPSADTRSRLRAGHTLIGLLDPLNNLAAISELADAGVTVVAFEFLPRTLSRAQSMDALSSQASAAGYRAGIVAADAFGRYLPMMITASGTAKPATAIVIGAGVAGLQAIATLKRLGAIVTGYDVRAASRGEVESLGAQFLTSSVSEGASSGGYARAMTTEEEATQQSELAAALVSFDIIITTAKVPGHTPPVLVTADTLASLRPGSVCVDLGSSERGGNVAGSVERSTIVTDRGVVVIGAGDLAADLPASSSQMYARNVLAALASLAPEGVISVDPTDEIHSNIVVSHDGTVVNGAVRTALGLVDPFPATVPVKETAS